MDECNRYVHNFIDIYIGCSSCRCYRSYFHQTISLEKPPQNSSKSSVQGNRMKSNLLSKYAQMHLLCYFPLSFRNMVSCPCLHHMTLSKRKMLNQNALMMQPVLCASVSTTSLSTMRLSDMISLKWMLRAHQTPCCMLVVEQMKQVYLQSI